MKNKMTIVLILITMLMSLIAGCSSSKLQKEAYVSQHTDSTGEVKITPAEVKGDTGLSVTQEQIDKEVEKIEEEKEEEDSELAEESPEGSYTESENLDEIAWKSVEILNENIHKSKGTNTAAYPYYLSEDILNKYKSQGYTVLVPKEEKFEVVVFVVQGACGGIQTLYERMYDRNKDYGREGAIEYPVQCDKCGWAMLSGQLDNQYWVLLEDLIEEGTYLTEDTCKTCGHIQNIYIQCFYKKVK